jgi:hypothetical protein
MTRGSTDYKGCVFNDLTAIEKIKEPHLKENLWKFLCECGNTCVKNIAYVKCGRSKNCGCKRGGKIKLSRQYPTGSILVSKSSGGYEVLEYVSDSEARIRFLETGTEKCVPTSALKSGSIKDPYYPSVLGVGYLGEGPHETVRDGRLTPAYKTWLGMLTRCYDEKTKNYCRYGRRGIKVSDEWHNFQTFAGWFVENYKEGLHLDKDLFSGDHKIYSKETCCFLPTELNVLLSVRPREAHQTPRGVQETKCGNFIARFSVSDEKTYLGTFETQEAAFSVYKEYKENRIKDQALKFYNMGLVTESVKNKLLQYEVKPYG